LKVSVPAIRQPAPRELPAALPETEAPKRLLSMAAAQGQANVPRAPSPPKSAWRPMESARSVMTDRLAAQNATFAGVDEFCPILLCMGLFSIF
jgi:hypothetical protein